jgi:hypothetical protein
MTYLYEHAVGLARARTFPCWTGKICSFALLTLDNSFSINSLAESRAVAGREPNRPGSGMAEEF